MDGVDIVTQIGVDLAVFLPPINGDDVDAERFADPAVAGGKMLNDANESALLVGIHRVFGCDSGGEERLVSFARSGFHFDQHHGGLVR